MRAGTGQVGRAPTWGLGEVLVGMAIAVFAAALAASIALGATGKDTLDEVPMWIYALVQTAQWIGFVGVPVLAARLKGNGVVADFGTRMTRADVPFGFVLGVLLQLVMVPVVSWPWLKLLGRSSDDLEQRARDLTDRAHGFGLVMLTLVVVVGAPFAEELFFRGLTLRSLERRFDTTLAVVFTAVLFAATHLSLESFPALAVFGLVTGYLVVRTGRLGPAWWTHVGFNATTIAILVSRR
jgi:membrane protease YdiL (CAAX protease family)